ncbi:glucosamine-6-phosphate deaminase [Rubellicoccus peritrichatus]|uniref:Glucosamine-6-phosphate deaminase n=1 Tax=Rubellicoccus peritrichatus TaxID=3080537 RepID=A0AAQ3QW56_9BACT|nr:glucosamine-6-phosphate deaminase [Puniceicoccus sp. CR14]WOO41552.1 glucosamine-6-phosphate deaminase [Puniceicoccus sp. CR14]
MNTEVFQSKKTMGDSAARHGAAAIRKAISKKGHANIIVATGASQFDTLSCLVQEQDIDWKKITGFHLDEYVDIPDSHPASFRRYLKERFVDALPMGLKAFHYVNADSGNPESECKRLESILSQHEIDVAFVGIGENGHLAFNDPPADFETNDSYIVVDLDEACRRQQMNEGWFPSLETVPKRAISMSISQIMKTKTIVTSCPDERKAKAVADSVNGPISNQVPASILQKHPDCTLYLDRASASLLNT